jgi:sulfatase maturation enzyme AslB (radical SAM superfamily)
MKIKNNKYHDKIKKAIESLQKKNEDVNYTTITRETGLNYSRVYNSIYIEKKNDIEELILQALSGVSGVSGDEIEKPIALIAMEIGYTRQQVDVISKKMIEKGLIVKNGKTIKIKR